MARVLSGREAGAALNEKNREKVERLKAEGISPCLAIVRVGCEPGDLAYERNAEKRCEKAGVLVQKKIFPREAETKELLSMMEELNQDPSVHGVLLLRPLPDELDEEQIRNALDPKKDVDAMTDLSMSGVFSGRKIGFPPCTAVAVMELLDYYGIDPAGKHAVVIGRSLVFGRPAAMLLLQKNATVSILHSRSRNIRDLTCQADLLLCAAGRAGMVTGEMIREGAVVIDVGINEDAEGNLCGDVVYEDALLKAEAVTPVPGGVGAVTTAVLVSHVIEAAARLCCM